MPLWQLSPAWKGVGCSLSKQMTFNEDSKKLKKNNFKLWSLSIIWKLLHCTHLTIHFATINISPQKAGSTNKMKNPPRFTKGLCLDLLRSKSCWELKGFYGKIAHDVSLYSCQFAFAIFNLWGRVQKDRIQWSYGFFTMYGVAFCLVGFLFFFFFSSSVNSFSVMLLPLGYVLMHLLPRRMLQSSQYCNCIAWIGTAQNSYAVAARLEIRSR